VYCSPDTRERLPKLTHEPVSHREITPPPPEGSGPDDQRIRALISAYACRPDRGSEYGVGWHWAIEAVKHHDVTVLTRRVNRAAIESELQERPTPHLRFVYHDLSWWPNPAAEGDVGERLYYVIWQLTAMWAVWRAHRERRFEVAHHLTFNTVEIPGFTALLGIPFVWGPVGGAQAPPAGLRTYFGKQWSSERVRNFRKHVARLNPWNRFVVRHAMAVLAANGDTGQLLEQMGARNLLRELETAIDLPAPEARRQRDPGDPFVLIWAGGLILRKAPALAIDVLRELRVRGIDARLRLAGDGPLRQSLQEKVDDEHLVGSVEFLGAVRYEEMSSFYAGGDAFLFTSLQDTSGNVVLEAMAHELPIVTLDHHGVGEIVTAETGVKVPPSTEDETVEGLIHALEVLSQDRERCRDLGRAGRERVATRYSWERKRILIGQIYAKVRGDAHQTG
jgi:glycosyltransferase involved in cell wall biosynthesis